MKLLPIAFNIQTHRIRGINRPSNYNATIYENTQSDSFTKLKPSFGIIDSKGKLRNIASKRIVHCIYCERPMQSDAYLSLLKKNGIFSGTIQNYVQTVFPMLNQLHPTEKEVFRKITMMAFDYPNIRLSEAIKKLYPEANKELLKEQIPILQGISELGQKLPRGYKSKFQYLMKITKHRLEGKEYVPAEFSGKEFAYKMVRISDTIKDNYIAQRIQKLTEPLTHPIFKDPKEPLTDKFKNKILILTETRDVDTTSITKKDLQLLLIGQIRKYAEILNRKDIINNCEIAEKTIKKLPVKIKFSNKTFRYDLNEILDKMPDKKLKDEIMSLTMKLPNSNTSVNAFITKHEKAASDAIGYNILRPSRATIEHMEPKSTKAPGVNSIGNYALACERCNNSRTNNDMKEFIKPFPEKNHVQYFKDLWREVEDGNLSEEVFKTMLNKFIEQSGRNINKLDKLLAKLI